MGIPSWGALVHFPDGRDKVVSVYETPKAGAPLVANLPGRWIVDRVSIQEGELEGRAFSFDVVVNPADDEHRVLLVHKDDNMVDGVHVYRGELPKPNQAITVETALSPVPSPVQRRRARVTHVVPGDEFPVRAMELEP